MDSQEISRRTVLSVSGVALIGIAGCQAIGSDQPPTDSEDESDPTPTSENTQTGTPSATTTPTPENIGQDDFSMTVEAVRQFTDEHPAQFQISLSNTSGGPLVVGGLKLGPHTSRYTISHESTDATLVVPPTKLIPGSLTDPETGDEITSTPSQTDGCWRLNADLLLSQGPQTGQLDAGETIRETFNVYTHRESDTCLQPGTYRFTEEHSFQRGPITTSTDLRGGVPVTFETTLQITEGSELRIEEVDISLPT